MSKKCILKWLWFNCDRIADGIDNFSKISRFKVVNMQNIAFLYKKLSTIAKCKKKKKAAKEVIDFTSLATI